MYDSPELTGSLLKYKNKAFMTLFSYPDRGYKAQRLTVNCHLTDDGIVDHNHPISGAYRVKDEDLRKFTGKIEGDDVLLSWEGESGYSVLSNLLDNKLVEKESTVVLCHNEGKTSPIELCPRRIGTGPGILDIYKEYRARTI